MARVGQIADRADGPWMKLRGLDEAVRLVLLLVQAYDTAAHNGANTPPKDLTSKAIGQQVQLAAASGS